jgi:hypothetical protein
MASFMPTSLGRFGRFQVRGATQAVQLASGRSAPAAARAQSGWRCRRAAAPAACRGQDHRLVELRVELLELVQGHARQLGDQRHVDVARDGTLRK